METGEPGFQTPTPGDVGLLGTRVVRLLVRAGWGGVQTPHALHLSRSTLLAGVPDFILPPSCTVTLGSGMCVWLAVPAYSCCPEPWALRCPLPFTSPDGLLHSLHSPPPPTPATDTGAAAGSCLKARDFLGLLWRLGLVLASPAWLGPKGGGCHSAFQSEGEAVTYLPCPQGAYAALGGR